MEASADADHLRAALDQNLREIDALRIANRKANDANKLLQQDISGLAHELKEAKALMAISIPRARLWWQRGALKITRKKLRTELADLEEHAEILAAELEALKVSSNARITKAEAEAAQKSTRLAEEQIRATALAKTLKKSSDAVTVLRRQQSDLVLTAREAAFKTRTMQAHVDTRSQEEGRHRSEVEALRANLHHARWQAEQARAAESAAREALYKEQMAHAATRDALQKAEDSDWHDEEGEDGGEVLSSAMASGSAAGGALPATSRRQRKRDKQAARQSIIDNAAKAVAQASALTAASEQLADERLREAAAARAEKAALEERVVALERRLRRTAELGVQVQQHLATSLSPLHQHQQHEQISLSRSGSLSSLGRLPAARAHASPHAQVLFPPSPPTPVAVSALNAHLKRLVTETAGWGVAASMPAVQGGEEGSKEGGDSLRDSLLKSARNGGLDGGGPEVSSMSPPPFGTRTPLSFASGHTTRSVPSPPPQTPDLIPQGDASSGSGRNGSIGVGARSCTGGGVSGSAGSGANIGGASRGTGAGLRIATRPITADAALSSLFLGPLDAAMHTTGHSRADEHAMKRAATASGFRGFNAQAQLSTFSALDPNPSLWRQSRERRRQPRGTKLATVGMRDDTSAHNDITTWGVPPPTPI